MPLVSRRQLKYPTIRHRELARYLARTILLLCCRQNYPTTRRLFQFPRGHRSHRPILTACDDHRVLKTVQQTQTNPSRPVRQILHGRCPNLHVLVLFGYIQLRKIPSFSQWTACKQGHRRKCLLSGYIDVLNCGTRPRVKECPNHGKRS